MGMGSAGREEQSRAADVSVQAGRQECLMSLHPAPIGPIPEETVRVVQAAFPTGTGSMQLRDVLGSVYEDGHFTDLFARASTGNMPLPWR
jgi:hypothetical protein